MARSGKLLLFHLGVIALGLILGIVECHTPRKPQRLSLCDLSAESDEECVEDVPTSKYPKFLLYKYQDGEGKYVALSADVKNITAAGVTKGSKRVWKILIHGFLNNAYSPFPVNVRDAYVERTRRTGIAYNILVVDWAELACASLGQAYRYMYNYAAHNTAFVGRALGDFIVFLHENNFMDLEVEAHLIGHSLGSHVAGQAGHRVYDKLGISVKRITGLDPAGPAFWAWRYLPEIFIPTRRLHRADAKFADIYHTSSLYGSYEKMGDVDFWISGGTSQPSCVPKKFFATFLFRDFAQICSHNYATRLFAKSILDNSMIGCMSDSYLLYRTGAVCRAKAVVGEMINNSTASVGEFYYDPPRDDSVIASLSWKDFSLKKMITELAEMVCP